MILSMSEVLQTQLNVRESMQVVSRAEISSSLRGSQVRISVVLVTRNNPEGALKAVQSVIAQNFQDWELLVIDDGNGAGIDAALQFSDLRIKGFLSPERGLLKARNAGYEMALCENVIYLSDDQIWNEAYLERCFDSRQFMPSWLIQNLPRGSQIGN
jgi:glycosyltransferase involved in cell wall biosynthesis